MATLTDDVARLQADVSSFSAFKAQVEAYIQENQAKPTVDTTALESALSVLESNLSTASGEVTAAANPTPAQSAPAPSAPENGANDSGSASTPTS